MPLEPRSLGMGRCRRIFRARVNPDRQQQVAACKLKRFRFVQKKMLLLRELEIRIRRGELVDLSRFGNLDSRERQRLQAFARLGNSCCFVVVVNHARTWKSSERAVEKERVRLRMRTVRMVERRCVVYYPCVWVCLSMPAARVGRDVDVKV